MSYESKTSTHSDDESFKSKKQSPTLCWGGCFGWEFFWPQPDTQSPCRQRERKPMRKTRKATFAKQLKMVFDNDMWFGWGTDEAAIRKHYRQCQAKMFFVK